MEGHFKNSIGVFDTHITYPPPHHIGCHIDLRVAPYLTLDRSEIKAVMIEVQHVQWIVLLFINNIPISRRNLFIKKDI